jgi:putative cell wall-binding protein
VAGFHLTRIAGADRYETSALIADQFVKDAGSVSTVVLASGEPGHDVDALGAAFLAGALHAPCC